jgi:hypothetical protein
LANDCGEHCTRCLYCKYGDLSIPGFTSVSHSGPSNTLTYTSSQPVHTTQTTSILNTSHTTPSDEQSELDQVLAELLGSQTLISTQPITGTGAQQASQVNYGSLTRKGKLKEPETVHKAYSYKTETIQQINQNDYGTDQMIDQLDKDRVDPVTIKQVLQLPVKRDVTKDYNRQSDHLDLAVPINMDTNAWLEQQQQKLTMRRRSRERTPQERQLVKELQSAQDKLLSKRAQSNAEEQAILDTYNHNDADLSGYMSDPEGSSRKYFSKVQKRYRTTDGPGSYNTIQNVYSTSSYTTYTSSVNSTSYMPTSATETYSQVGPTPTTKPPPSPVMQRSNFGNTPPSPMVPTRTSSKDAVSRSRSLNRSEWTTYQQSLQHQNSEPSYDRSPYKVSPTHSPRSQSPIINYSQSYNYQSPPQSAPASADSSFSLPTSRQGISSPLTATVSYETHTMPAQKSTTYVEKRTVYETQ